MIKMNNELVKKELKLTDVGYSKDFTDKNNKLRFFIHILLK